jgi:hypothetical protein
MRKISRASVTWISVVSLVGCGGVAHSLGGNASGGAGFDVDSGLQGNGFGGNALNGGAGLFGGAGASRGVGGMGGLVLMADSGVGQGGENGSAGGPSYAAGAPGYGGQTMNAGGATSVGGSPGAAGTPVFREDAGTPQIWRGSLTGYSFPSGSSTLFMQLIQDHPRALGYVQFGSDGASAPSDPNLVYPDGDGSSANRRLYEGVPYIIRRISYPGTGGLQFEIAPADLWEGYCSTLAPIALSQNPASYGCVPSGDSGHDATGCYVDNHATGMRETVACGKLALCGGVGQGCRCTVAGCTSNTEGTVYVTFQQDGSGAVEPLNGHGSVPFLLRSN